MAISEQLRIGSAIARFFSGGGGPSHSAISSALMAAGYEEPHIDTNQNKQERVNSAFRRSRDDPQVQQNLIVELLLTLYDSGFLDSDTTPDYIRLVRALQVSGFDLDEDGFLIEKDSLSTEDTREAVLKPGVRESSDEVLHHRRIRRVLISHAEVDTAVASQVARFIEIVCRLEKAQILCTSVDGYGLDPGEVWIEALRKAIREGDLIVFLISDAFLSSDFCGFELGAAWMSRDELQRFPIRLPGVRVEQLSALPGSWHCPTVSETVLSSLVDRIVQRCHLQQPPATYVTSELAKTMEDLNSIW